MHVQSSVLTRMNQEVAMEKTMGRPMDPDALRLMYNEIARQLEKQFDQIESLNARLEVS